MGVNIISKELLDKIEKHHKVKSLKIKPTIISKYGVSITVTTYIKGYGEFVLVDNLTVSTEGTITIQTDKNLKISQKLQIN